MSNSDWLKTLAPALGTALFGPLGGAAASYIADKLGIEEKTVEAVKDAISSGRMTADQIAGLKQAEIEFQKFLEANKIKLEEIHAQDRSSARAMQIATNSWVPPVLAIGITVGFFSILSWMLSVPNEPKSEALLVMLGALGTAWGAVVNFFFGSSASSRAKTELLYNSTPAK